MSIAGTEIDSAGLMTYFLAPQLAVDKETVNVLP